MTVQADDASHPWQLEEVPCDFCGASQAEVLLSSPDRMLGRPVEFRVVRCTACGLARMDPRPTAAGLAAGYAATYVAPAAPAKGGRPPRGLLRWALVNYRDYPLGTKAPPAIRWLLRPFGAWALWGRKGLAAPPYEGQGRLLDFGCGTGKFVARMAAAGWHAEGLDLSPDAVRAGRAAGLNLREGTLPGTDLPPESCDVVTMWGSLEHVPSPKATLAAARTVLRPGGLLLVAVPRFDSLPARWFGPAWYPLGLPLHLTQFTRASLRRYVESAGFRVERTVSVPRSGWLRGSFAHLADDTGRGLHRRLSRSRVVVGLMGLWSRLAGRAEQVICLARRPRG